MLLRRKISNMLRFSQKISFAHVALVSYLYRDPAFDKMLAARNREWKDAIFALRSEQAGKRVLSLHDKSSIEGTKAPNTQVGWFAWICVVTWSRILMAQRRTNATVATSALHQALLQSVTVKRIPELVETHPSPARQWIRNASEWSMALGKRSIPSHWPHKGCVLRLRSSRPTQHPR